MLGQVEQLVVRDAAPQEERQPRGDLQVAEGIGLLVLRQVDRLAVYPQQEVRVHQDALQPVLDARLEAAAFAAPRLVELQQRIPVAIGHRPAIRAAGDPRQDRRRAGAFLRGPGGLTDEDRPPAGSVRESAAERVRATDVDRADRGVVHVDLVVRQHAAALQRLPQPFRLPQLAHERHADHPRARGDRHAQLQPRVPGHLHVLFPLRVAREAGLAGAGVARRHRPAGSPAADLEPLQEPAVEADVELLRPAHAHDVVLVLPAEPHADDVFAVDGEVVRHGDAAARAEGQVLALAVVLHDVQGNLERLEAGRGRRQARGEPRDLARDRQVALQVDARDREHVGEVVEAAVGGLVARQQRPDVEAARVERDQVAQRVGVLRAVQAVDGADAARLRVGRPGPVELGLQRSGHGVVRLHVGARPSGRRHGAGAQLLGDAFPHLGMVARPAGVEPFEHEPAGAQALAVAAHAVTFDERAGRAAGSLYGR